MKRWILGLGVALSILVPTLPAQAQYKPYGTHGVRILGIPLIEGYRYPVGGVAAGYGYAPAAGYGYGYAPAAGYGYAPAAGYGFGAPMMGTGGGCTGNGAGYGFASPGFGYGSQSFSYGGPQAGLLSTGLSILEALREAKKIREELGGGGASDAEYKALKDEVASLKLKYENIPTDTKASIEELKKRLEAFPPQAVEKLKVLEKDFNDLKNLKIQDFETRIKKLEDKVK